jgi:hypothetical protein
MIFLSNENLKAVNGANIELKNKSKMRLCIPRRLEQDAPVYVHELFLLNWTQLKIANWQQAAIRKNEIFPERHIHDFLKYKLC